jgi:hypothetical protein
MAVGLGGYGYQAKLSPAQPGLGGGTNKPQTTAPAQSLTKYGTPLPINTGATTPLPNQGLYQSADAEYIRNLPTAYTPEQALMMKTNATNVNAAGTRGMTDRLREVMAAQGLSGGGAEAGRLQSAMLGSNANLANQMSGIDISNANQNLQNSMQKGGMIGNLMNLGLNENQLAQQGNQFNQGIYSDLYKYGTNMDYQKYLDQLSNQQYNDQYQLMLKMMGAGGSGSYGGGSSWTPQRSRG